LHVRLDRFSQRPCDLPVMQSHNASLGERRAKIHNESFTSTCVSLYDTRVYVIKSFRDDRTRAAFEGVASKGFPADLLVVTRRKLGYLNAAAALSDLRAPPGNRLEALKGDRQGQHSIRVNDQWRICFVWTTEGPKDVEFVDYHR
jgi:toxin HigB-1